MSRVVWLTALGFLLLFIPSPAHAQTSVDLSARTDSLTLPAGTVAQRPGSPVNGMLRYDSSTPAVEGYVNGSWLAFTTGSLSTINLGVSASATNPQRNGQGNTGLFSATTNTVSIAAGGTDEADFAAAGLNLPVSTESYKINGNNAVWQDANYNLAVGQTALPSTISQTGGGSNGQANTAVGAVALNANTTGVDNTAVGAFALATNTTGTANTVVGAGALQDSTIAGNNTAVGYASLQNDTTGGDNTAMGYEALIANTTGYNNTALGEAALNKNTTGTSNTVIGFHVASTTLATGSNNILIGTSNAVDTPAAGTNNFLNIGNVLFATGITGTLGSPAGKVGIGTTAPAVKLTVAGTDSSDSIRILSSDLTGYVGLGFNPNGSHSNGTSFYSEQNGGGALVTVWDTGGVSIGTSYANNDANGSSGALIVQGNVGIGTTSPGAPLTVVGAVAVDAGGNNSGTTGYALLFGGTGGGEAIGSKRTSGGNQFGLDFYTGYTDWMSITNTGNVGIGTTSPSSMLHLYSSGFQTNTPILTIGGGGGGTDFVGIYMSDYAGRSGGTATEILAIDDSNSSSHLVFGTAASGSGTAVTERMRITNAGNVGIGTTSPGTSLDVNGAVTTEPTSVTLSANNTVLSTANSSYFRVTSNNTTVANRIFCMGSGTPGQRVIIEWTSSTDKGEIVDGGTCSAAAGAVAANLSATWAPAAADATIELIYNGTKWLQLSVSVN